VTRNILISAPAQTVFRYVDDLRKWDEWSPWAKIDPAMKTTFSGAQNGKGAIYAWQGNNKVGEGRMTIVESEPEKLVRILLEFIKPFKSVADTEFTFVHADGQTSVSWSMIGKKNFASKAFCLFMDMDKKIGGDFEKGLSQLKTVCEASPAVFDGDS
jgi:uncharacterized protein YndB with AHSA1/START domain